MDVRDELIACGGKPIGDAFNQSQFKQLGGVESNRIPGGYCAGVVLDWTRRVLQSSPMRPDYYLSYSKPDYEVSPVHMGLSPQAATVNRMATAYEEQAANYVGQTDVQKTIAVLERLSNAVEEKWNSEVGVRVSSADAKLIAKCWQIGQRGTALESLEAGYEPAGFLPLTTIADLRAQLAQHNDPQLEARAGGGRHWETTAAVLDNRFRQIRISESRQVPKKLFSNLRVVRTSPSRAYNSGGAWLAELVANGLVEGCCTTLSFKPTSGGSGHQVAVHQLDADVFRLFDPNYGTFEFNRNGLEACFQHLFWASLFQRPIEGVLDGDKAVYLRRDKETDPPVGTWNRMAFTVFGLDA